MDSYGYSFPAIRGIQSGREYYVSQCPLHVIPKIFQFDDADLPPEVRAQRVMSKARLPEIANYILTNRESYVFSALTASVDGDIEFVPFDDGDGNSRLGHLRVPMNARFVINDGQHRRGAIEQALEQDPTLRDETIAVVFFLDRGLERSQQMFADLNRYAVKPSTSLGVLYDHRDPIAAITRSTVADSELLRDVVEPERTTLSAGSRKLFTLSSIFTSTRSLLAGSKLSNLPPNDQVAMSLAFWNGIAAGFPEWELVRQRKITAAEVRRDFIHSHGIVLHALGRIGNNLLLEQSEVDWKPIAAGLRQIDWTRSNARLWEGRALVGGRVAKSTNNVLLTTSAIKTHLELQLTADEIRVEAALAKGRS
jgi:DNA sulfur modification protein DndB